MIEAQVKDVIFDETSAMGIVLLKEINGERVFPIWVGIYEAQAILLKLQNTPMTRPLTHDLLNTCIQNLNGRLDYIYINKLQYNIFFAEMHISQDGNEIIIDARPSDAIAIAIRAGAPIYVNEQIFNSNSISIEKFIQEQEMKNKILNNFFKIKDDHIKH